MFSLFQTGSQRGAGIKGVGIKDVKVSIITASFNSAVFIADTYRSISNQEHSNWEWLVTDDCSSDETLAILQDIELRDPRVKVFKNPSNLGAAEARNMSISQSTANFIAFLDADDLWAPEKLRRQLYFMISESIGFSFTSYKIISENGQDKFKFVDQKCPVTIDYYDLLSKKATVGCSTVMVNVDLVGRFSMPQLRTGQDYATWLSILKRGYTGYLLKEPLTSYRIVQSSISRDKFKKALRQWEIYRNVEKLTLVSSMFYFFNYAFRAIFRK